MTCEYCALLEENDDSVIYRNDKFALIYLNEGFCDGHLRIIPVEHIVILEHLSDSLVADMFLFANKVASVLFEGLKCGGTNILINNGGSAGQNVNHLSIDVLPRFENDGIDLSWELKQADQQKLEAAFFSIKDIADGISFAENDVETVVVEEKKEEVIKVENGQKNYLLDQLNRLP
jgi:histidine triad (HIT) family protein